MTVSPKKVKVWYIAPSDSLTVDARPLFPEHNYRRIEMRPHTGGPLRCDDNTKGWVDLPGDDIDAAGDMLAFEAESAIGFFNRMGTGLRVCYSEGIEKGRFPNNLRDPHTISKGLRNMSSGFGIRLEDVEFALTHWVQWLKPDEHKGGLRSADILIARRMLSLLRDGRHAGAISVLFFSQEVYNPNVEYHGR